MLKVLKQLSGESAIYGMSVAVSQVSSLILTPIYTRLLTPEEFGILVLVNSLLSLFLVMAVLGLDNSAFLWYWKSDEEADRRITVNSWVWPQMGMSLVMAIAMALLSKPVAALMGKPDAELYLELASAALPLRNLMSILTNWLRLKRLPWGVVAFNFMTMVAMVLATLYFLLVRKEGLRGILVAQIYACSILAASSLIVMRKSISLQSLASSRVKEMLKFSLPLIPAALAGWGLSLADRWLMQLQLPTSEIGIYQSSSVTVAFGIGLFVMAFQQAWAPFAFSLQHREDCRKSYAYVGLAFTALAAGLALLVSAYAREIIGLAFGRKYLGAASTVPYLAFSQVLSGCYYVAALGCNMAKDNLPIARALFLGIAVQIPMNLFLVHLMGRDGAGLASLLTQISMVSYLFAKAQKAWPIPYDFKAMLAVLLVTFPIALAGRLAVSPLIKSVLCAIGIGYCLKVILTATRGKR